MSSKLNYLIGISLKRKIKTKWFIIVNILLALLIIGIINIDSIITLFGGDFNRKQKVYVIDNTNETFEIFENALKTSSLSLYGDDNSLYEVSKLDINIEEAQKLFETEEDKDSIIIEFSPSINYISAVMYTKEYLDPLDTQLLNSALNSTKTNFALSKTNIPIDELNKIYSAIEVERIYFEDDKNSVDENMEMVMTSVFPIMILPFFMLCVFLIQMIGAEVNDEKSTHSMEIIISNVSAKTHFFSKVIAGNLFVIFQGLLLFSFCMLGLLIRNLISDSTITTGIAGEVSDIFVGILNSSIGNSLIYILPLTLLLMLLTFIAYSLLAGILASITTNTEDFQQLQTPMIFILLIGYYLSIMASFFKGALFIKILSFIPLISAILSPSLLVLGQISVVEIIISIILTLIFIFVLVKYGLKIYKVGILNYSSKDLWKKMFKAIKE